MFTNKKDWRKIEKLTASRTDRRTEGRNDSAQKFFIRSLNNKLVHAHVFTWVTCVRWGDVHFYILFALPSNTIKSTLLSLDGSKVIKNINCCSPTKSLSFYQQTGSTPKQK